MSIQAFCQELFLEMEAIDQDLEEAAKGILNQCEDSLSGDNCPTHMRPHIEKIIEYCYFHDLNSQRLHRAMKNLQKISETPSLLDDENKVKTLFSINSLKDPLSNGPQRKDKSLTQDAVESILSKTLILSKTTD